MFHWLQKHKLFGASEFRESFDLGLASNEVMQIEQLCGGILLPLTEKAQKIFQARKETHRKNRGELREIVPETLVSLLFLIHKPFEVWLCFIHSFDSVSCTCILY